MACRERRAADCAEGAVMVYRPNYYTHAQFNRDEQIMALIWFLLLIVLPLWCAGRV
jgi:hypothetical protein